jgi:ABC-2 type transport system permease protein
MSAAARETNATISIAAREIMRLVKSPGGLIVDLIFPMFFLGIMGGSLSQNLAGNIGYNFLQFVMIGMIVFNMFMGTTSGMTSLIAERNMNLTQELFVSPISRYTIILGKMIGTSIASLVTLIGILIMALIMRIPLDGIHIVSTILAVPAFCLVGASFGMFFIGLIHDPKVAQMGALLICMPQMFLAGTIIPISHSSGILAFLADIMPLTYLTDLARGIFYWGRPEYKQVVIHNPLFNIAVSAVFFLIFSVVGTIMFTNSERNK